MSASPQPPRPVLWKYIRCPSGVNVGARSFPAELMCEPRFTGVRHAHAGSSPSVQARCETQMSVPPKPPVRSELMYRLRPSLEIAGCCSFAAVLITGPRLTGADQGPYWGCSSATSASCAAGVGPVGRSAQPASATAPSSNRAEDGRAMFTGPPHGVPLVSDFRALEHVSSNGCRVGHCSATENKKPHGECHRGAAISDRPLPC